MSRVRRCLSLVAAAGLLVTGMVAAPSPSAYAAGGAVCINGPGAGPSLRFVVGQPDYGSAGAVDVTTAGQHYRITEADLGVTDPSGGFGAVVLQDQWLNNDRCPDLIVSAPGRNGAAGSVYLILGTDEGFGLGVVHRIKSPAGAGNSWGATLAYIDASAILAVGAPGTPLARHASGAVWLYPIDQFTGGPGTPSVVTQDSKGVPGAGETGDSFGASLAARWRTLVIGAPGEAVGTRKLAGAVTVLFMGA